MTHQEINTCRDTVKSWVYVCMKDVTLSQQVFISESVWHAYVGPFCKCNAGLFFWYCWSLFLYMTSFVCMKVSRLCVFLWYVIACNVGLFCIYQVSRFFGLGIFLKTRTEIFCAFIEIYRHLLPTRTHTYIHAHQAAMAGLDCVALFDGSWLRPLIYINVYIHTHTQNVTPLFCTFT